jgi:hypothetical protein
MAMVAEAAAEAAIPGEAGRIHGPADTAVALEPVSQCQASGGEERIMGDQLDKWIEANSRTLQALAGPGQPGIPPSAVPGVPGAPGAPEPAFGPQPTGQPPGGPPAQGAFPPGATDYSGAFPGPAPAATPQPAAFDMPIMQPQAAPVEPKGPPTAAPKPRPKGKRADDEPIGMERPPASRPRNSMPSRLAHRHRKAWARKRSGRPCSSSG